MIDLNAFQFMLIVMGSYLFGVLIGHISRDMFGK
jgi:hypothetical protein